MKLFTIGDSISQGFMSGAAARTDLCYSTLIAQSMQLNGSQYIYPKAWEKGGLPLNLEKVLRHLAKRYGSDINGFDWVTIFPNLANLLDEVEDYYERGAGAESEVDPSGVRFFHNVAVQGFDVADAWLVTPEVCKQEIVQSNKKGENRDGFFALPNAPFYRTALKVLNPSLDTAFDHFSQLEWLRKHATQSPDGVENLIIWLGANNALGTVFGLNISQTPNDPDHSLLNLSRETREQWNLWHPSDFAIEYRELLDRVDEIMQDNRFSDWNVFIGTVPLVTIAPLTRGVGPTTAIEVKSDYEVDESTKEYKNLPSVYYKYYTHFFRDEAAVLATDRAYLTLADALHIDDCIREYNRTIKELIVEKNQALPSPRYHVVDMSKALQQIAFKRNAGQVQYQFPEFFDFQYPRVNTVYYHADKQRRLRQGGIFSLDGVHPSAIGQGLIAHEFLKVMKQVGIVHEEVDLNWKQIFASDTLYNSPIPVMGELYENKKLAEFVIDVITRRRFTERNQAT
jgi:lysophospholipase L1-like esterase